MKKWMFLIAFGLVLVGFQAKTAHAVDTPLGVAQCGGNPGYVTCQELTGIVSGPPVSIQNIGPLQCFPNPGDNCSAPEPIQCKITWSSGYTITQWAGPSGSCHVTYGSEVLGSFSYWGVGQPTHTAIAPAQGANYNSQ